MNTQTLECAPDVLSNNDVALMELAASQLAVVGGGSGNVIFG